MEKLILWILMAYGMTSILVWGSIFETTRIKIKQYSKFFGDLIQCTLCTSTWVGFFMSLVLGSLSSNYFETYWIVNFFFDAMFTAGSVWAINSIVEYYEEKR
jgi:general stress protein CsbA